jgi:hypothetical protein
MKFKYGLIVSVLVCCLACNDSGTQQDTARQDTTTDDTYISTTPIPLDGCYRMIFSQDTASMRLNVVDSLVTGELSYRLYAKDKNDGSIKGVIRDNLIIADYTFRSEGMLSVRQVVFKMEGTTLTEGYGDLNTASDTVRFKDIGQLKFMNDRPFGKIPCIQ